MLLDLRGNGGGLLSQSKDITGLFIEKGPVVQARGAGAHGKVLSDEDPNAYFEGHVVALVDRFSASASEIFAAAIQDYNRGIVLGQHFARRGERLLRLLEIIEFSYQVFELRILHRQVTKPVLIVDHLDIRQ